MEITSQLKTIAESFLKDDSYFIVDVISKGVSGRAKHLILLDGDNGVNIDDCASLSRQIAAEVEAEDLIEGAFILEVSSPGLDHPLASKRQFAKNVGRKLKVRLQDGTMLQGKLESVEDEALEILKEVKEKKKIVTEKTSILFDSIDKANVLVSFN
ncbi:ribosome maturation factor RimP [Roseivirga sp.]|uniref:ribosome maturation factor RimP n=1 Tax=Roseivirga sp. TaxID=1964215 RepID=UPI003B8DDCFD